MDEKIALSRVYIDDEVRKATIEALNSGWYILGEKTKEFEGAFAGYCGSKYAIAVSSGTAAIFLSLLALDVGPGDEVIVPSHTAVPTVSPILHVGASPIFVDVDPETYTTDPERIESKLSERTKAILPVHIYGHSADLDPIQSIAQDRDLFLIEDCCQAHGAEYKGTRVGTIGEIGCFSFYPSKNLTVCGDGGMVITDDDEVAEKIRMLRDHGRKEKYIHELLGYNLRFNEIQAAIGLVQLNRLPNFIMQRRSLAKKYNQLLREMPLATPKEMEWAHHVYHLYVIRTKKRDQLREWLKEKSISTGIHYPVPVHQQPGIKKYVPHARDLENTEKLVKEILSLPMHPQLNEEEQSEVVRCIKKFLGAT